jgi:hypothetical protein
MVGVEGMAGFHSGEVRASSRILGKKRLSNNGKLGHIAQDPAAQPPIQSQPKNGLDDTTSIIAMRFFRKKRGRK